MNFSQFCTALFLPAQQEAIQLICTSFFFITLLSVFLSYFTKWKLQQSLKTVYLLDFINVYSKTGLGFKPSFNYYAGQL